MKNRMTILLVHCIAAALLTVVGNLGIWTSVYAESETESAAEVSELIEACQHRSGFRRLPRRSDAGIVFRHRVNPVCMAEGCLTFERLRKPAFFGRFPGGEALVPLLV